MILHTSATTQSTPLFDRLMPLAFVLLWSTGFVGAQFGLPYASPLVFLTLRMALAALLLGGLAVMAGARWPRGPQLLPYLGAGLLVHGCYLGGVFIAIGHGLPTGMTAMIVGVQPLLTAALAGPLLGERVRPIQWLGFVLGLVGVALVLWDKLVPGQSTGAAIGWQAVVPALVALLAITAGVLVQKRHGGGVDMRAGMAAQYAANAVMLGCATLLFEQPHIAWTGPFLAALAWLTLVLSGVSIVLMYRLIQRGAAARVSSLFYLVPPVTALEGFVLFGETLAWHAFAGMALAAVGVALAFRR
jgi:drug/metabolite transporter (DMT)-like permease